MKGIFVEGLEMPNTCRDCRFCVFTIGKEIVKRELYGGGVKIFDKQTGFCGLADKFAPKEADLIREFGWLFHNRESWCPLREVDVRDIVGDEKAESEPDLQEGISVEECPRNIAKLDEEIESCTLQWGKFVAQSDLWEIEACNDNDLEKAKLAKRIARLLFEIILAKIDLKSEYEGYAVDMAEEGEKSEYDF